MGFPRWWLPVGERWCSSLDKQLGTCGRKSSAETAFLSRQGRHSITFERLSKRWRHFKRDCCSSDLHRELPTRERNTCGYGLKRILFSRASAGKYLDRRVGPGSSRISHRDRSDSCFGLSDATHRGTLSRRISDAARKLHRLVHNPAYWSGLNERR